MVGVEGAVSEAIHGWCRRIVAVSEAIHGWCRRIVAVSEAIHCGGF